MIEMITARMAFLPGCLVSEPYLHAFYLVYKLKIRPRNYLTRRENRLTGQDIPGQHGLIVEHRADRETSLLCCTLRVLI